ncbi:hypothetical protein IQ243_20575 [Nostocales cyanobacterium LEGE 11386]|nr:hypothetical protein [Nostocales cyanobacterium LEGE 11386]
MAIKSAPQSQYSDNPKIPRPIINVVFENKGIDPESGKPIVNIKTEFKDW